MSVLEKIRAEIEQLKGTYPNEYYLKIIDKYASECRVKNESRVKNELNVELNELEPCEECDNDCEHCAYLECPKEVSE